MDSSTKMFERAKDVLMQCLLTISSFCNSKLKKLNTQESELFEEGLKIKCIVRNLLNLNIVSYI